jgi:membrane protein DedA with SNARE-associated domain
MLEEWVDAALDWVFGLPEATVYLLVGVFSWAEAAFFLGFVTPGELAIAGGGVLASRGQVSVQWVAAAAAIGTVLGNSTGFWLGRLWGSRVLESRVLQRPLGGAIQSGRSFLVRRGEWAIVLGRFASVTRITVPFLMGASRTSYRRFLLFDVPTGVVWAVAWVVAGFFLGESWRALLDYAGPAAFLILILAVSALILRWIAARVAANQRRIQAAFRLFLRVTGLGWAGRLLLPAALWVSRRFNPRLAAGLGLTTGFLVLIGGLGAVGLVMSQTQAVRGVALLDFPLLEWMGATRTDEAVRVARGGLRAFHWPGVLLLAVPIVGVIGSRLGGGAAVRITLGLVGSAAGAYYLDRFVLEGLVPRAEFPSVPVAVAAALLVHLTAAAATRGWTVSVRWAAIGTFLLLTVALGTVVAGWAAPSGILLGLGLGLTWGTLLEMQGVLQRAVGQADQQPRA